MGLLLSFKSLLIIQRTLIWQAILLSIFCCTSCKTQLWTTSCVIRKWQGQHFRFAIASIDCGDVTITMMRQIIHSYSQHQITMLLRHHSIIPHSVFVSSHRCQIESHQQTKFKTKLVTTCFVQKDGLSESPIEFFPGEIWSHILTFVGTSMHLWRYDVADGDDGDGNSFMLSWWWWRCNGDDHGHGDARCTCHHDEQCYTLLNVLKEHQRICADWAWCAKGITILPAKIMCGCVSHHTSNNLNSS